MRPDHSRKDLFLHLFGLKSSKRKIIFSDCGKEISRQKKGQNFNQIHMKANYTNQRSPLTVFAACRLSVHQSERRRAAEAQKHKHKVVGSILCPNWSGTNLHQAAEAASLVWEG